MSIDLRSHKTKVVIYRVTGDTVGLDVSANFLFLTGSDNKIDTNGLISFVGTLELAELYSGNPGGESLDDRINPTRWAVGNKILVDITNSSGVLQRYTRGFLRILNSSFNPVTRRLTLEVGDILALLSFRQPEDDKSGVEVGVGLTRTAIINNLLTAAGCPLIASGPTEVVKYRLPRFSGSYIEQAAAIAYPAGYFLWCDKNEAIQCDRIDLRPTVILKTYNLSRDVARYERLSGSEKPCEIVRTNGTTELLKDIPNPQTTSQENYSTKGQLFPSLYTGSQETILESRTKTTVFWDVNRKIETTTVVSEAPFAATTVNGGLGSWSNIMVTTSVATVTWKTDITKKFYDSQGRLSKIEHTDARPPGYWVVYALLGVDKTPIIGAKDIVTYTYNAESVVDKIDRLEYQLLTTLLQGLRTNYADTGNVAFKLVPFKQTVETWTEVRKGVWKYATTEATSKEYLAGQQILATPGAYSETTSFTTTNSHSETGINNAPPQTEYHQPKFDSESKQLVGEARFNTAASPFKPRIREYSIEYATSVAQLNAIASLLGGFLYGRDKGQQIDVELSDTILTNYKPLARIDVYEGGTSTQSLLLDGCSWVLTQNTAKLSADAVWSGSVLTSAIASINTTTDEIIAPNHGLVEAQPITFAGISTNVAIALGIDTSATYYVSPTSPDTYTISEVPGGMPVVLPVELPISTSPIVAVAQNVEAVTPPYSVVSVMRGGFRFGGEVRSLSAAQLPTYGTMRGGVKFGGSMVESAPPSATEMHGGFRFGGILSQVLTVLTYSQTILADTPIAYYRLGETNGTTALDSSPNNRNATYVNSPTLGISGLISGDTDTAIQLNGTNYVNCGNLAAFQLTNGSLEGWIKTSTPGGSYRGIFVKQLAYGLFLIDGILGFYDWGGGAARSTGIYLNDGNRHQVGLSFQSGIINGTKIYLDGQPVLTTSVTVSSQAQPLLIGSGAISEPQFIASVCDEFSIYDSILTDAQFLAHFNSGIGN